MTRSPTPFVANCLMLPTYSVNSTLRKLVHRIHQGDRIVDRRLLDDPVSQVEDVRSAGQCIDDVSGPAFELPSPGKQQNGIEITLHRRMGLQFPGRPGRVGSIVYAHSVDFRRAGQFRQVQRCATGKGNHGNMGVNFLDPEGDLTDRCRTESVESMFRQYPRPGIE